METKDKKKIIFMKTKTCSYEDFDPLFEHVIVIYFHFQSDSSILNMYRECNECKGGNGTGIFGYVLSYL